LNEAGAPPSDTLDRQIAATSMNPSTGDDVFRFRLSLQYEDSAGVLDAIARASTVVAGIPDTTSSVRHIKTAYATVREFLASNFAGDPTQLKRFLAAFTHRVKLIRIVTPDLSRALKVFETINDRGVGLNAMDLLKNLLFMRTDAADYSRLKDRWKELVGNLERCGEKPLRFLRYFVLSSYEIDASRPLREDEIYAWFERNADRAGIAADPIGFLDRLVARSRDYAKFAEGKAPDSTPVPYLRNIAAMSGAARQHFLLLLAGSHLPPDLFAELARRIENLFFCYLITREPTKMFERSFARWSEDLRAVRTRGDLDAFVDLYVTPDLRQRSKDFDFAMVELDQGRIQAYRLRYVLAKLTQFVQWEAWQNAADRQLDGFLDKAVHVEHILPTTPTPEVRAGFDLPADYERYSRKLGNLVLLEMSINTSVSNGPYADKREAYRESKFLLTRSLVEKPHVGQQTLPNKAVADLPQFEEWTSTTIDERQRVLARLARRVWQIPEPVPGQLAPSVVPT